MVAIAGATEEVAFSPFFGPAGRLLKNSSLLLHVHISDFMLGRFLCFHQTPCGNSHSALLEAYV
jgi:hypothetical protein